MRRDTFVLLGICLLATGSAHGQASETVAGDSTALVRRPPGGETRPTFLLPDVVVEGEDQSQLAGGMRFLDVEIPGVGPTEVPMAVEPGPTDYRRRYTLPFGFKLPPPHTTTLPQGLLRITGAGDPSAKVSGVYLPASASAQMLWIDLGAWRDRLPGRNHRHGSVGALLATPGAQPDTRVTVELRALRDSWGEDGRDTWSTDASHALFFARAVWEQRVRLWGLRSALGVRARGGRLATTWSQTNYDVAPTYSDQSSGWGGVELQLVEEGSDWSPRRFDRDAGTGPDVDLLVGVMNLADPWGGSETVLRWKGHVGLERGFGFGQLRLGLAGGGEGETHTLAPYLALQRAWRDRGLLLRAELAPRVSFASDIICRPDVRLPPESSSEREVLFHGEGISRLGAIERYDRHAAVEAEDTRLPTPTLFNPRLPAERAWPGLLTELVLLREHGWLHVTADLSELRDPLSWHRVDGTTGAPPYASASLETRWMAHIGLEGSGTLTRETYARLAYVWTYDEKSDSRQALLFVPEHELHASVHGRFGSFLWGTGLHARAREPAGDGAPAYGSFAALSAFVGWSFGNSDLGLTVENLFGSEITYRPGDGLTDPRVSVSWEHTFLRTVP